MSDTLDVHNAAQKYTTRTLIGFFWKGFLRNYRLKIFFSILCMAIVALMTALSAKLVKDVFDGIFVQRNPATLVSLAVFVLIIFSVKGFAAYGHSYLLAALGQNVGARLQRALFRRIMHSDYALFVRYTSGKLLSIMTYDTQVIFRSLTQTLVSIVRDALTLILLIGVMFYQDWLLAAITCVGLPLSSFVVARLGARMRHLASAAQKTMGDLHTFFQQHFQGISLVKAYTLEDTVKSKARQHTEQFVTLSLKNAQLKALLHPLMETLGGMAVAFVLLYGGYQVIGGLRTPGELMSFIAAFLMSYEPLKKLAHLSSYVQEALAALERIYALFTIHPNITQKENAQELIITKGDIVFQNISFGYKEETPLLQDFSCTLFGGKRLAIVGASGAGKTTLFRLLLRFYDPVAGQILIDGQDTRDVTLGSLRRCCAYVSQETFLFEGTVAENIKYGDMYATDEEVVRAARLAYADEFIKDFPLGYNQSVGEMGNRLSGGQRQRIAIARAFLKNAPLLLLDEATSALDTQSELSVQKALHALMDGRTTLIIAHRLLTAQQADRIYVMDKGKVVAEGKHSELLDKSDTYRQLIVPELQGFTKGAFLTSEEKA